MQEIQARMDKKHYGSAYFYITLDIRVMLEKSSQIIELKFYHI